ncbi:MAG: PAN/Apple domain-containing protein, partial [Cypionkella sp.]|nr:PAN/Apple domain-containing protein [Cypionkella sp.]
MTLQNFAKIFLTAAALLAPMPAASQDLIPQKRFILYPDTDFAGGDIASVFNTTLDACQRACAANSACEAITFNTRNGSCFAKAEQYVT